MISGVNSYSVNNKTNFASFETPAERYYLSANPADTNETAKKSHGKRGKALAISVVGTSLAITAFMLLFGKKFVPQKLLDTLEKFSQKIKKSLPQKTEVPAEQQKPHVLMNKINNLKEKMKGLCNFSTFKDLVLLRMMYAFKATKKLHANITSKFEKLARNTVNKKYGKSEKSLRSLSDLINSASKNPSGMNMAEQITINGVAKTRQEWLNHAGVLFDRLKQRYVDGFGAYGRDVRFAQIDTICDNLDKKVVEKMLGGKSIKDVSLKDLQFKNLTTFIAEDTLKADKQKLNEAISSKYTSFINDSLESLKEIYGAILPEKSSKKIANQIKSFTKKLNIANKKETIEYFDKMRDLKLGAGVTDVASVLGSVAGVGIGLSAADDKDTRISAALKYGIPVISTVAVSVISTIALISGLQAMAFGLATGLVVNRVGAHIDKVRKHVSSEQQPVQVAKQDK